NPTASPLKALTIVDSDRRARSAISLRNNALQIDACLNLALDSLTSSSRGISPSPQSVGGAQLCIAECTIRHHYRTTVHFGKAIRAVICFRHKCLPYPCLRHILFRLNDQQRQNI